MNLQTGAFGDPNDPETLIMFWEMMAGQHYPGAAEIRERLEKKRQEQLAQMQMQQLPQETQMPTQQVSDVGVEDASGSAMNMMW